MLCQEPTGETAIEHECIKCGEPLIPNVNWSPSRIRRKDYVHSRCRNRGFNRGIYTKAERLEFIKSGNLTPRPTQSYDVRHAGVSGVYFITYDNNDTWVKIGWSTDCLDRFKSFTTGSPHDIIVLAVLETNDEQLERKYHSAFHDVRGRGEWFERVAELDEIITDFNQDYYFLTTPSPNDITTTTFD